MKFGLVKAREAQGAILAHSLKLSSGLKIAKGSMLSASDLSLITGEGIEEIIVAQLSREDIGEDEAAMTIAAALAGQGLRLAPAATGRVNIHATCAGLFVADSARVDAINAADPGITLASLKHLSEIGTGRMVATVKIIPYGIAKPAVSQAVLLAKGAIGLDAYEARRIGVVSTMLPSLKTSVMDKTIRILEERLRPSRSTITREIRTSHDAAGVAAAIGELLPASDIVLVFGASAICDIGDVIPSAIRAVGGKIVHFGMPVDPGNLMLLGEAAGKPVIGAPGCARSPAENGFDWILQRLVAGRKVTSADVTAMGVGGLLMEIGGRPQPREARARQAKVAAIILAAGMSSRMGPANKLLEKLEGKPLLAHVLESAKASSAADRVVVSGHEARQIEDLAGTAGARTVHNARFAEGMATSLAAGIAVVPADCSGAIILLGDMPRITASQIDRMIGTFSAAGEEAIVMATHGGVRGNPVLWPRRYFAEIAQIEGDKGARDLLAEHARQIISVELGEAAGFDVDTPQALAAAGGKLAG